MKRFFFLLLILLISFSNASAQPNSMFVLEGQIIGTDEPPVIYLEYRDINNQIIKDSCRLDDGHFRFTGFISQPTSAYLKGRRNIHSMSDPQFTSFYIEPGFISGRFPALHYKAGTIIGSKTEKESSLLEHQLLPIDKKRHALKKSIGLAKAEHDTSRIRELHKTMQKYIQKRIEVSKAFILNHPRSYVSIERLAILISKIPSDTVAFLYGMLSHEIQNSRFGLWIRSKITLATPGSLAPDFTQKNMAGDLISLHDFRGKYVFLNFWAPWCVPCMEEMKYLKKLNSILGEEKLVIIGISLDKNSNKWLHTITKYQLDWIQLSDHRGNNNAVALKYNVNAIPQNYLIGKDGHILSEITNTPSLVSDVLKLIRKE